MDRKVVPTTPSAIADPGSASASPTPNLGKAQDLESECPQSPKPNTSASSLYNTLYICQASTSARPSTASALSPEDRDKDLLALAIQKIEGLEKELAGIKGSRGNMTPDTSPASAEPAPLPDQSAPNAAPEHREAEASSSQDGKPAAPAAEDDTIVTPFGTKVS